MTGSGNHYGHGAGKKDKHGASKGSIAEDMESYRAVFIGTDDDYLQRVVVRRLFEMNALEAGDALLFDIPNEVLVSEGEFLWLRLEEMWYFGFWGPLLDQSEGF